MIDPELAAKLDEIERVAQAAYTAADKARKYLFWTGVVTVAVIVIPLIGLAFVLPAFINSYVAPLSGGSSGGTSAGNFLNSLGY